MMSAYHMFDRLVLPLMCAPMSFASSVPLTVACCQAGIIGGWQGGVYTSESDFESYLRALHSIDGAPPIVNLPSRWGDAPEAEWRLELLADYRVPLVLSSLGDPTTLARRVHTWGGQIIQDVTTMRHARKAISAGVDGLMLTCAGAGGHTGFLTPLAFVPAVRKIFDGLLIVGGGIADVNGIAAALTLGGDIACMGTRFIATPESGVFQGHRSHIENAGIDDIVISSAMNGVPANWIAGSLVEAGFDPRDMPAKKTESPNKLQPWRDIFSAGQSVELIDAVEPVEELVSRLSREFAEIEPPGDWMLSLKRFH